MQGGVVQGTLQMQLARAAAYGGLLFLSSCSLLLSGACFRLGWGASLHDALAVFALTFTGPNVVASNLLYQVTPDISCSIKAALGFSP